MNLVYERDVAPVYACEKMSGRSMVNCKEITDDIVVKVIGPVIKTARLTKIKLADIRFDEVVKKTKTRKISDKKDRQRAELRAVKKTLKRQKGIN